MIRFRLLHKDAENELHAILFRIYGAELKNNIYYNSVSQRTEFIVPNDELKFLQLKLSCRYRFKKGKTDNPNYYILR